MTTRITTDNIADGTIENIDIKNGTIDITSKVTGSISSANLGTIPVSKGGTGLTSLGGAGQAIKVNSGGSALEFGSAGVYESALFHIQNEHATHQSTSIGTSYTDFIFNTVKTNEITGASLSSNEVTLPSGTYFADIMICTARCNAFVSRLYNTTDSSLVLEGALMYADTSHTNNLISFIKGRFTIAAQKTFKIQGSSQTAASTYGQGYSQSSGSTLSTIWMNRTALFWKVA